MRVFTVLGPSGSGKSTLVQALAGLDGSPGRTFSVPGVATVSAFGFMGEDWAAIDIPGGAENLGPVGAALAASDIAVVCVPADAEAAVLAAPYLRMVEEAGVPSLVFINRIDSPQSRIAEIVSALQAYSRHHIVLREVPIREGDTITGFVDLVSERAWKFADGKRSVLIEMPESVKAREAEARAELLESYADFDDALMEELIEDRQPMVAELYDIASRTVRHHDLVACFLGSAGERHGINRLMKSLRHDAPGVEVARDRLGADTVALGALADVIRHLGKIVLLRALGGPVAAGAELGGATLGSVTDLDAKTALGSLAPGGIGLAVKSDHLAAGRVFTARASAPLPDWGQVHASSYRRIVTPVREKDDGRLLAALDRLAEIDPGLRVSPDEKTGNPILAAQGPLHLRRVLAKIADDFGIAVNEAPVPPALRETVRRGTEVHHRHRKQTGGAGQFADVSLRVEALPFDPDREDPLEFVNEVVGGVISRGFMPAIEKGVREAMAEGLLSGNPVIGVRVAVFDGKEHPVDSKEIAFKSAGKEAFKLAAAKARPVITEPIYHMEIVVPDQFAGDIMSDMSTRRGRVQGMLPTGTGKTVITAQAPLSEIQRYATDLRGMTQGRGRFSMSIDHYEDVPAHLVDAIVAAHKKEVEAVH